MPEDLPEAAEEVLLEHLLLRVIRVPNPGSLTRSLLTFSAPRVMTVANSSDIDGQIAILFHCMANLTFYLLKVANMLTVDRHLRYPGKL
jgi:hypothetical protein